jgi:tryptophanyl-tRNA synthetase
MANLTGVAPRIRKRSSPFGTNALFILRSKVKDLKELYTLGRISDVAVKHYLAEVINRELEAIRQRRFELSNRKGEIIEALRTGTIEAQTYARQTLADVQDKRALI